MSFKYAVFLAFLIKASVSANREKRYRHQPGYECDDGQHGISMDLHGDVDWKCMEKEKWPVDGSGKSHHSCYQEDHAFHVCIDRPIDNLYSGDIPHSGPHRKVWGQYGEYNYLPPGRYVHNLEHGGVVFMYHPCAPTEMVNKLRMVATTCLYRYILTAFRNLTRENPFAVVTYGCVFRTSSVNQTEIKSWIRSMFGKSPEADVYGNGKYNFGLLVPSVEPEQHAATSAEFCQCVPEKEYGGFQSDQATHNTPVEADDGDGKAESTEKAQDMGDTEEFTEGDAVGETMEGVDLKSNMDEARTTSPVTWTPGLFWALTSLGFLTIGLFSGLCLMKIWSSPGDEKEEGSRVWNANQSEDSFSVAAVVRKFPRNLLGERKTGDQQYQRIKAGDQSSDEENVV